MADIQGFCSDDFHGVREAFDTSGLAGMSIVRAAYDSLSVPA